MAGRLLGVLEPSVVLQVNRDTGSPPGVWIWATSSLGSPVMIVQVCSHSSVAGSFQPSHRPAKTKGASSFIAIEYGILPPTTFFHS
jgi:hypothetical protein